MDAPKQEINSMWLFNDVIVYRQNCQHTSIVWRAIKHYIHCYEKIYKVRIKFARNSARTMANKLWQSIDKRSTKLVQYYSPYDIIGVLSKDSVNSAIKQVSQTHCIMKCCGMLTKHSFFWVWVTVLRFLLLLVFTALHGMPTRSSDENSVRLSVRLSNACIVTKRKKAMLRFLYHMKEHLS